MTKEETLKILTALSTLYTSKQDARQQAAAWYMVLQKYDYQSALAAVFAYAENDSREYASFPPVGAIVEQIKHMQAEKKRAVNCVIRSIGYGRQYDDLTDDAKLLISQDEYKSWLNINAETFAEQQNWYAAILTDRQARLLNGKTCNTIPASTKAATAVR